MSTGTALDVALVFLAGAALGVLARAVVTTLTSLLDAYEQQRTPPAVKPDKTGE